MRYFLLIELSKRFISFKYYLEGNDGLIHMGEPIIPLSIYCNGTKIEITEVARDGALNGPPYYDDIFEFMKKPGCFVLNGEEIPNNEILLRAIEPELDKILHDCYVGYKVKDNRARIPLGFVFGPDLDQNARRFVVNLFAKAGYVKVRTFNSYDYLLELGRNNATSDNYVIVTETDSKMYGTFFNVTTNRIKENQFLGEIEANPKEERLCSLIFEDVNNGIYDYDNEKRLILEKVYSLRNTIQFKEGKGFFNDTITLSDGSTFDFDIEAAEIANSPIESGSISKVNYIFETNNCFTDNTVVIVSGMPEQVDRLNEILSSSHHLVKIPSEKVDKLILKTALTTPWESVKMSPSLPPLPSPPKQQEGIPEVTPAAPSLPPTPPSLPSSTTVETRQVKRLKVKVKRFIGSYSIRADVDNAILEGEQLLEELNANGVADACVEDLKKAVVDLREKSKPQATPQPNVKTAKYSVRQMPAVNPTSSQATTSSSGANLSKLKRDARILLHSWQNRVDLGAVIVDMEQMLKKLRDSGVTDSCVKALEISLQDAKKKSDNTLKFDKEVERTKRMVSRMVASDAIMKIDDLLKKLHKNGVTKFDDELKSLKDAKNKEILESKKTVKAAPRAKSTVANVTRAVPPLPARPAVPPLPARPAVPPLPARPAVPPLPARPAVSKKSTVSSGSTRKTSSATSAKSTKTTSSLKEEAECECHACKYCGELFVGNYCPNCGNKAGNDTVIKMASVKPKQNSTLKSKTKTASKVSKKIPKDTVASNLRILKKGGLDDVVGTKVEVCGISYSVEKDGNVTALLTSKKCKGDMNIPVIINVGNFELYVTSVKSKGMFTILSDLKSIVLPNSLQKLESFVFSYSGIRSIIVPESVKSIGDSAFAHSELLEQIQMPSIEISTDIFKGCKSLKEIKFTSNVAPEVRGSTKYWTSFYTKVKLLVPKLSVEKFKNHSTWGKFKIIEVYE